MAETAVAALWFEGEVVDVAGGQDVGIGRVESLMLDWIEFGQRMAFAIENKAARITQ